MKEIVKAVGVAFLRARLGESVNRVRTVLQ